ncbi:MAG: phosphotransferase family protein [Porticoccaceae bacterium]
MMTARLQQFLAEGGAITGIKTLSAGHSNETYYIEGLDRILRLPPSEEGLLPPYDMSFQYSVMSAVYQYAPGVPMPQMYELCTDKAVLGDDFFIMEKLPGEAFEYSVPAWLAADPVTGADAVCRQWFDAILAIHNMPAEKMPAGTRTVTEEAAHWLSVSENAEADARLIEILTDLTQRPPGISGLPTPVHGDPKHGNCMWHHGKLSALLDWEMTQVSEPLLDLGYILMFHDQGEASLANAGFELPGWWSRQRMIDEWEKETSRTAVDIARYEVLGQAKVAAIIALGAFLYNTGRVKDERFKAFAAVLPAYIELLSERAYKAG